MNLGKPRLAAAVPIAAAVLALASCKQKEPASGTGGTKGQEPAAIAAVAVTGTSTVQAVNPENRTVTLRKPDGTTVTYTLGKDVTNGRIKPGDEVKATVIDAMAVYVRKAGTEPSMGGREMKVAPSPRGAKPGTIMARTVEITDKIEAVDTADRTITLQGVAGKPQTLKVGPNVDLSDLKKGDDVVVRQTQALRFSWRSLSPPSSRARARPRRPGTGKARHVFT